MKKTIWKYVFLILLFTDIAYTFMECYHMTFLDGDLSPVIVPGEEYKKVLEDPFGLSALLDNKVYAAPNRFFHHWTLRSYFRSVPFFFQKFTNPINSLYITIAFIRTAIQVLLIFILAGIISKTGKLLNTDFLLAAVLITPPFQIGGFSDFMGITMNSISYTWAYALPLVYILLFYSSFISYYLKGEELKFTKLTHARLIILAFIIPTSGSIVAPVVLVISSITLISMFVTNWKKNKALKYFARIIYALREIPFEVKFYFSLISLLSLYSFYIGTFNLENTWNYLPLTDRYQLLPKGFWFLVSTHMGLPILIIMTFINYFIIKRINDQEGKSILNLVKCLSLFCLIYILLLPLGGYRFYRPLIVREDTFSPVTLALILTYGLTVFYLLSRLKGVFRNIYIAIIVVFIFAYSNADKIKWNANDCERASLYNLSISNDKIVLLDSSCPLMTWRTIKDYHDSELNSELLQYWGVLKEKKFYYQEH